MSVFMPRVRMQSNQVVIDASVDDKAIDAHDYWALDGDGHHLKGCRRMPMLWLTALQSQGLTQTEIEGMMCLVADHYRTDAQHIKYKIWPESLGGYDTMHMQCTYRETDGVSVPGCAVRRGVTCPMRSRIAS